jgi:DNA-binding FadR family transcriptional regulator
VIIADKKSVEDPEDMEISARVAGEAPALRRADWEIRRGDAASGERTVVHSRAEMAAAQIAALVRTRGPGARLGTKDELRALSGVSVGTFNEAMRLVQVRGLVTVRPGPGGGLFVAEQSPMVRLGNSVLALDADQTSVEDAMRIRDALDPLLVDDAVWHSSRADIVDMRAVLRAMDAAAKAEDAEVFIQANWRLHARIAAISPNPVLRSIYVALIELIESHTIAVAAVKGRSLPKFLAERHTLHVALVDAIADRDAVAARKLILRHGTMAMSAPATRAKQKLPVAS